MVSFATQSIALKDEERDQWGQVIEQMAKQWARMPDPALAIHGRRVYQVFSDIGFRSSEALVPELSKWADIVAANDKALAIDTSTDCIVSLGAKAKKVGGLYLSLNGVAVRPTDSVDAKKEYALVQIDGSSSGEVTPVTPE